MKLDRRNFMKKTVAGAAALTFSTAEVYARADNDVSLRFGVIGIGNRSRHHIKTINNLDGMQVAALCDVRPERLTKGLNWVGKKVNTYDDYQKLLNDADINAVIICTPNLYHKQMIIDSLDAGKYVMCEKPMAVSWDECIAIKKAEQASSVSVPVLYTMQLRYAYKYQETKSVLQSGKIGKPQYILLPEYRGDWAQVDRHNVWLYTRPETGEKINWRYDYRPSGGTLSEKMCHYFDIITWMVGHYPTAIKANGGINHYEDNRDTWDHASVHIEYPHDIKALASLCMYAPRRLELQIIGEEGSLLLSRGTDHLLFEGTGKNRGKKEQISLTEEIGHGQRGMETAVVRMYRDFLDCVENNKKPLVGIDKAMSSVKIAWLAEKSSREGRKIYWNALD